MRSTVLLFLLVVVCCFCLVQSCEICKKVLRIPAPDKKTPSVTDSIHNSDNSKLPTAQKLPPTDESSKPSATEQPQKPPDHKPEGQNLPPPPSQPKAPPVLDIKPKHLTRNLVGDLTISWKKIQEATRYAVKVNRLEFSEPKNVKNVPNIPPGDDHCVVQMNSDAFFEVTVSAFKSSSDSGLISKETSVVWMSMTKAPQSMKLLHPTASDDQLPKVNVGELMIKWEAVTDTKYGYAVVHNSKIVDGMFNYGSNEKKIPSSSKGQYDIFVGASKIDPDSHSLIYVAWGAWSVMVVDAE